MTYQKQWIERNDSVPGYVYLVETIGYHGLIPGRLLHRCKIGLSRNPQKRLDDFHSNQPPCDLRIVCTIFVENMATVEAKLHQQFKHCSVKLQRSKEWFDLNPLQLLQVQQAFNRYETPRFNLASTLPSRLVAAFNRYQTLDKAKLPSRLVVGSLIGLLGSGLLLHSAISQPEPPKPSTSVQAGTLAQPKLLHKKKSLPGRKNLAL